MTRKLRVGPLEEISTLATLREMAAQEDVARVAAELRVIEEQISDLRNRRFEVADPLSARLEETWRKWQDGKLRDLTICQADLLAKHRIAAERLARMRAERDVIDGLTRKARRNAARLRERRGSYIS